MCPLLEDFVSLQTSIKCGPKCAPCWKTVSHCGLWPVVQKCAPPWRTSSHCRLWPMWFEMCPSLKDFVTLRTLTKCGPNMCPSMEDFVFATRLDHIWINNVLIIKQAGTKQTVPELQSTRNWNRHLWLCCHMISTLEGTGTNEPWQENDASCIHHATNDKWCRSHTTTTNSASYLMRDESILIGFTWTTWNFLHAYAGHSVNAMMIALFACWRLEQNGNYCLHCHSMVKLAVVYCRRKRQKQQHHQRTNGSTKVKTLQVQTTWTYLTYLQYQGNLAISKL